ncbi:MAG: right-handed parallel beta-helix repeat-containing protein [Ardenticatenaceae bacterium]|nr:right-handed parallel beta-helix repeat-containing protein [Ardenticatenaceae bacterium]
MSFQRIGYVSFLPLLALVLLAALIWLMGARPTQASPTNTIFYVTDAGSGSTCSQALPCALQTAVTNAAAGDEVHVAGGTYTDSGPAVVTVTTAITLTGGYDAANWGTSPNTQLNPTILDGESTRQVVRIEGDINPVIENFEIVNGRTGTSPYDKGAGIYNESGSPLIRNNDIHNNQATAGSVIGGGIYDGGSATIESNLIHNNSTGNNGQGGGIYIANSGGTATTVRLNEIDNNSAALGAGVALHSGEATLEANTLHHNTAVNGSVIAGGGFFNDTSSTAALYSNLFYANSGPLGGGLALTGDSTLWNNTIAENSASSQGGGIYVGSGTIQINNTIIAFNTASTNDGIHVAGGTVSGGYNNVYDDSIDPSVTFSNPVSGNPNFVSPGSPDYNYHLPPGSPDVDAGDPATPAIGVDMDGQPRPYNGIYDVGADEYGNLVAFTLEPPVINNDYQDSGTIATYHHTLHNTGNVADTYTFSCSNDQGWNVTCPSSVALSPLAQTTLSTLVEVTGTARTRARTLITAVSTTSPTISHTAVIETIVAPHPALDFTPNYSATVLPGETFTYTHMLTNTGDALETFNIELVDGSWAQILPTNNFPVDLLPGATMPIRVVIAVPATAPEGLLNETIIRASSDYDPAIAKVVTDTLIARPTVGTRYVSRDGDDTDNNCTQVDEPCNSVGHAIGQASFGDEIRIARGTYFESGIPVNDTVYLSGGWSTNFRSQGEPRDTIIDAELTAFIFDVAPGSTVRPSFSNMVLQNGASGGPGGAVFVGSSAQPAFEQVIFQHNSGTRGGAIYAASSAVVTIQKSEFINNTASDSGGALYSNSSIILVQQSGFYTNTAVSHSGAIYINGGQFVAENNLFSAHTAGGNGGALFLASGQTSLWNNTFVNNQAGGNGGAIYNNASTAVPVVNALLVSNTAVSGGAIFDNSGNLTLSYSDLWQNSLPEVSGGTLGDGILQADPLFRDEFFRLDRGSPALDHGDPNTTLTIDFEDDFRPADSGFDMGWDELVGCRAQRDGIIYSSIQEAIDAPDAVSDLIRVTGTCRGVHTINDAGGQPIQQTVHLTQTLTIQGGWNNDFTRWLNLPTYVDPEGLGRGFYVSGAVTPTLESLYIVNGDASGLGGGPASEDAGGGIYNLDSSLILQDVRILTNTAVLGGGFYNHMGTPVFHSTAPASALEQADSPFAQVAANTAVSGGGIYNYTGTLYADSMRIYSNTASSGGGIFNDAGPMVMSNTVIYANEATGSGGGIYNQAATATFWHLTVFTNTAGSNGGGFYNAAGDPLVHNTIFQSNRAVSGPAFYAASGTPDLDYNYYHDYASTPVIGANAGGSSITDNVTPPGISDPNGGDFHLEDTAVVIDIGDPLSPILKDFEGNPRPNNQGPDMGADEAVGCYVMLGDVVYGSIQAALEAAEPGETLNISGMCSGVHSYDTGGGGGGSCGGAIAVTIHLTKSVNLVGGWDAEFLNQDEVTTLDALELGRVMYIGPGVTSTIEGFDMVNGLVAGNGGAICMEDAAPTIKHNQFYSNTATNGGAIYSANSAALLTGGNRFFLNEATAGAAVYASGSTAVTVQNNFMYSNTAVSGGAFYNGDGDHNFWHNTIYSNTATSGGAVYVATDSPLIRSNIFISNTATTAGAIFAAGGATPSLGYNDYLNNTPGDLSGVAYGSGYLIEDPAFNDLIGLDFTVPFTSPVVDVGDPTLPITDDFQTNIRPSHNGFDIGADEFGGCYARVLSAPDVIYGSVQAAVDAAPAGDVVQIDGTCYGVSPHELVAGGVTVTQTLFVNKDLIIDGDWNYEDPITATLDALGRGRTLYVGSSATLTVTNLILQGGNGALGGLPAGDGGGIYVDGTLVLRDSEVLQNQAVRGGGVFNDGYVTMMDTAVHNNQATHGAGFYNNITGAGAALLTGENRLFGNIATQNGGAVYQMEGTLALDGNRLFGNYAASGGAIYLAGGNDAIDVWNNFIFNNSAGHGGGVYNLDTNGRIWHNTILGNSGDGLYSGASANNNIHSNIFDSNGGAGIHTLASSPDIVYNIVISNSTNYAGTAVAAASDPSNQSVTPVYVDRAHQDYHLHQDSPGVDEGDDDLPIAGMDHDYDGDLRPTNAAPDIGADEINTCYIRVIDPDTDEPVYFGKLQDAIEFAEDFPNPNPRVEIARGTCSGVEFRDGTYQVGYISEDLHIIGSLRHSNFSNPNDYVNPNIAALSTAIDAQGEGRVFKIAGTAVVTLEQVAMVNGNAYVAGGGNNGGAVYYPGPSRLETDTSEACQNYAENGGGYFIGSTASAYVTGAGTGSCWVALFDGDEFLQQYDYYFGNTAMSDGGGIYVSNGADVDVVNHGFGGNTAAGNGGGLYNGGQMRVINGIFSYNYALSGDGGGVYNGGGLAMYHNTVRRNTAVNLGGGIYQGGTSLTLNSSIIYSNTAANGGGLHVAGGSSAIRSYDNFNANSPNDTNDGNVGTNHISGNPLFAYGYALSQYSPNIDQADPALLLDISEGGIWADGIDFDAGNYKRPDVHPTYNDLNTSLYGYASDVGADEYWKEFGCDVLPNNDQSTIFPGEIITYSVAVFNVGYPNRLSSNYPHGYTDTITITLSSSQGWATLSGGAEQVVELDYYDDVEQDDRVYLTLTVAVPITSPFGVQEQSLVECRSASLPSRSNTSSFLTNAGLVSTVLVEPEYITQTYPGQVLTFTHYITNTGNEPNDFYLIPSAGAAGLSTASVTRIEDTDGAVYSNTLGLSDVPITIGRGEMITALLQVNVLETAASGEIATPGLIARAVDDPSIQGQVINQITISPTAGTRYVAPGGVDEGNNCLLNDQPCATVQHAVDQALDGDSILVAGGLYTHQSVITTTETLVQNVYINKSVSIIGGYSTTDNFAVSQPITNVTALDGEDGRRVIYITPGHDVTLSGLFVQNGHFPSLTNDQKGSGIYNGGSNLTIENTQVLSGTAVSGGGLYHADGDLTVHSSVFAHNDGNGSSSGSASGSGIFVVTGTVLLENNTFANNIASISGGRAPNADDGYGGAVYQEAGTLSLINNIFSQNEAGVDGFAVYISATLPIANDYNLYFNNSGGVGGADTNFSPGAHSFSGDPTFADTFFHIGPTSAAKDTGTNSIAFLAGTDFEGDPRQLNGTVDIGADERVQHASFTFVPVTQTATILPNISHVYTHTLTNNGDTADTYTLILNSTQLGDPADWDHNLTPSNFALNIGASQVVTLMITGTVPGDVDTSTITATPLSGPSVAVVDTTIISSTAGVDIGPSRAGSGEPTMTVQYQHTLTNTGNGLDSFDLHLLAGTPPGWTVTVEPAATGIVPTGGTIPFTVSVTIPAGTAVNTIHTAEIEAVSQTDGTAQDTLVDTTTVLPAYGLQLLPAAQSQSVMDGATAVYTHTLTNLGNISDTVSLTVTESLAWGASINPAAIALNPGASATVTVTVPVPPNTGGQVHVSDVTAASEGPGVTATAVDTTTVLIDNSVAIGPDHLRIVDADTQVIYQFTVTNTGNVSDTFNFTQDGGTQGWVSGFSGSSALLAPDDTTTVILTVTVPAGATPGTEDVTTVSATSTNASNSATATTRVRQLHGLAFAPNLTRTVDADSVVTYTHTLTNTGNGVDTFTFAANSSEGWAITLPPDVANLGAGLTANVVVTLTVPPGPGGITDTLRLTASSVISPAFTATVTNTTVVTLTPGALDVMIAPDNEDSGLPGELMTYYHTVTNTGTLDADFVLTAVSNQSWTTTVQPPTLSLLSGASEMVTVTVQIPSLAGDGVVDLTTVTVQDTGMIVQDTAVNTTTVTGVYSVVIAPNRSSTGIPGETLTYTHVVTNTGDFADSYSVGVSSSQSWTVTVTPDAIPLLIPGESTPVTVTVAIPSGAANGQIDVATVTAQSLNAAANDSAADTSIVQVQGEGVLLEPDHSDVGAPGEMLVYHHTLTNTGSSTLTFLLATQSSQGWVTAVTPDRVDNLAAGDSHEITVTVAIPAGAVNGTEDWTSVAATAVGEPTITDSALDHTTVEFVPPVYGVMIAPDNTGADLPGAMVTYQHTVTNTGNVTETFALESSSSQGWVTAVTPNTLDLPPGSHADVTVSVTIPAGATTGTIDVTTVTVSTTTPATAVTDSATDTTAVNEAGSRVLYLPVVLKACVPTGIDLVITNITVTPNPPTAGQPATVSVTIQNQGTVDMDPSNNFFLDAYVDHQPEPYLPGDGNLQWGVQARALTAGASVTYNGTFTFSGGTHQIWAQVDTDRTVDECPYEDNNTFGPIILTPSGHSGSETLPPIHDIAAPRSTPTPVPSPN